MSEKYIPIFDNENISAKNSYIEKINEKNPLSEINEKKYHGFDKEILQSIDIYDQIEVLKKELYKTSNFSERDALKQKMESLYVCEKDINSKLDLYEINDNRYIVKDTNGQDVGSTGYSPQYILSHDCNIGEIGHTITSSYPVYNKRTDTNRFIEHKHSIGYSVVQGKDIDKIRPKYIKGKYNPDDNHPDMFHIKWYKKHNKEIAVRKNFSHRTVDGQKIDVIIKENNVADICDYGVETKEEQWITSDGIYHKNITEQNQIYGCTGRNIDICEFGLSKNEVKPGDKFIFYVKKTKGAKKNYIIDKYITEEEKLKLDKFEEDSKNLMIDSVSKDPHQQYLLKTIQQVDSLPSLAAQDEYGIWRLYIKNEYDGGLSPYKGYRSQRTGNTLEELIDNYNN